MDFTTITPSLDYRCFLRDCLESVASQEGVTLEHLVIGGSTTDDSARIAAEEGAHDDLPSPINALCGVRSIHW
jgi:glycosyltransferase involved in cell wall biosynthesis